MTKEYFFICLCFIRNCCKCLVTLTEKILWINTYYRVVFFFCFREDFLMSRARKWLDDFIETLNKDEIKRNRDKLLEINHFLDIQKEEYDELISEDKLIISADPLEGLI